MTDSSQSRAVDTLGILDSATTQLALPKWLKGERAVLLALLALTILTWLPRLKGPIDLRWDGGVYYILGTSLAQGKGYKLLNEPGEIDAVQYPPLLPVIIAAHQLILGTDDPTTVGRWLRFSAFLSFIVYIYVVYRFFKKHLSLRYALLAALLCLFSLQIYFLSDLCFPEILFGLTTLLFVLCNRREESRVYPVLAYLFAVVSYALRTVGIVAFAAWVLESLVRRRFKQAVLRAALVLIPILCWQFYVASVESSYEYNHPAYTYQRAPYMFYNVSYARNVSLREPYKPERGYPTLVNTLGRFVSNVMRIPGNLGVVVGEVLYLPKSKWVSYAVSLIMPVVTRVLFTFGLFVITGIGWQLLARRWIIPLYVLLYLCAMCITPYPGQFSRYLMPIIPFLNLSFFLFLLAARTKLPQILPVQWAGTVRYFTASALILIVALKVSCFLTVYTQDHQRAVYLDRNNKQIEYQLFFYDDFQQALDRSIDWLRQQAKPDDVVAATMPHWLHLRTGLKTVMTPFEIDAVIAQQLLDSVPVSYLIIDKGPVDIDWKRYSTPVTRRFRDQWRLVYSDSQSELEIYQRTDH